MTKASRLARGAAQRPGGLPLWGGAVTCLGLSLAPWRKAGADNPAGRQRWTPDRSGAGRSPDVVLCRHPGCSDSPGSQLRGSHGEGGPGWQVGHRAACGPRGCASLLGPRSPQLPAPSTSPGVRPPATVHPLPDDPRPLPGAERPPHRPWRCSSGAGRLPTPGRSGFLFRVRVVTGRSYRVCLLSVLKGSSSVTSVAPPAQVPNPSSFSSQSVTQFVTRMLPRWATPMSRHHSRSPGPWLWLSSSAQTTRAPTWVGMASGVAVSIRVPSCPM